LGIAVISFDFSSTLTCLSSIDWPLTTH
jgi:hypothetical protein